MRLKVIGQDSANQISRVLIKNVNFNLFISLDSVGAQGAWFSLWGADALW